LVFKTRKEIHPDRTEKWEKSTLSLNLTRNRNLNRNLNQNHFEIQIQIQIEMENGNPIENLTGKLIENLTGIVIESVSHLSLNLCLTLTGTQIEIPVLIPIGRQIENLMLILIPVLSQSGMVIEMGAVNLNVIQKQILIWKRILESQNGGMQNGGMQNGGMQNDGIQTGSREQIPEQGKQI